MFVLCGIFGGTKISMRILLILLVMAVVLISVARKPRPAVNQSGAHIDTSHDWSIPESLLTIASYNVQTGKNLHGERDISKSAKVISQADVVGIQEVYAKSWLNRFGFGKSQSMALAAPGRFGRLFAATRYRWFRENRGNLLLSKIPIDNWKVIMLPDQSGKSFRNMMVASFSWQSQTVTIISTHLHTGVGRQQQLEVVLQEFAKHPRAILLGDFNTTQRDASLKRALADDSIADAVALAGLDSGNTHRIDWILTKGFEIESGRMHEKGVSDHPYYEVSLKLKQKLVKSVVP